MSVKFQLLCFAASLTYMFLLGHISFYVQSHLEVSLKKTTRTPIKKRGLFRLCIVWLIKTMLKDTS